MSEENPNLGKEVEIRQGEPPNERKALAHIPPHLPLEDPLDLIPLFPILEQASKELGGLNALSLSGGGPQLDLLLRLYALREATFSSHIEGTKTSLLDLLLSADKPPDALVAQAEDLLDTRRDDRIETMNCVYALEHGWQRLRSSADFSLSMKLLCELHETLFKASARGANKGPGEIRTQQNCIKSGGRNSYIPPPVEWLDTCLDNFERQFNNPPPDLPLLVQAAILHAQFESIHPFMDGNGRVGRLLIVLFLCQHEILDEPSLYLSLYFKKHRPDYFQHLNGIRKPGGWEAWIAFFLEGVRATAFDARFRARKIQAMHATDRKLLVALGRKGDTALRIQEELQHKVVLTTPRAAELTQRSYGSTLSALELLEKMNIVREYTGQKRNRVFVYKAYMDILAEDTEPDSN